jgi:glucokinase
MKYTMPNHLHADNILVADIGGTNARFAVSHPNQSLHNVRVVPTCEYASVLDAAYAYLRSLDQQPTRAAFAVATSVEGDTIGFTNNEWSFS